MTITFPKPQNLHALYTCAKKDAEKRGITWTGDM